MQKDIGGGLNCDVLNDGELWSEFDGLFESPGDGADCVFHKDSVVVSVCLRGSYAIFRLAFKEILDSVIVEEGWNEDICH